MSLIYNREAILEVGLEGQRGKDFSNLRISFQIEKTSESNANTSEITIYNLNADSRAFLEQENLVAVLKAGYTPQGESSLAETIFRGDIRRVENKLSGSDWQTNLEVGDGEKALVEKSFNKSFAKGVSLRSAIEEVAQALGKPISTIKDISEKVYQNGLTLSGSVKDLLDELTAEAGVEWSVQDGEVIVLGQSSNDGQRGFLLSRDTGMIGTPVRKEKGIEIQTALNPKLRPGKAIRIQSKLFSGDFRIRTVRHIGDSFEGEWSSKVEAVE